MNIVYIGSEGSLSYLPLQALIESKYTVCALVVESDSTSDFNVTTQGSVELLAINNSIPLVKLNEIPLYEPDVILVSCYARRLPQAILSLATKGSFNVHPSLLPAFRGPVPLFWQFRQGINNFGVTIHRMTDEFDAGDIISQQAISMPDGINKNGATEILADVASKLMLQTLDSIENLSETKQANELASCQSYPLESDYSVSTLWPAKRIYNFINAYKGNGVSFLCEVDGNEFKLIDALSYQEEPYNGMAGKIIVLEEDNITMACMNSYIRCKVRP